MAVDVGTKKQGGCPPPPPPKAFRPHPRPERPFPPPPPPPPFMPGPCCPPTNTLVLNNTIIKSVDNALKITEGYVHGSPAYFIEFDGDMVTPNIVGEDPIEVKEGVFTEEDGSEHNGFLITIKDMVGATADNNGKAGTVPAPKAGDQTKFLRADGTWATITIPEGEQSDWSEQDTDAPSYIKNKPELATVATTGSYNDLTDKPTIVQSDWAQDDDTQEDFIKNKPGVYAGSEAGLVPHGTLADQEKFLRGDGKWATITSPEVNQSDWTEQDSSALSFIKHKPELATVATTGSYEDLTDKPTIDEHYAPDSSNAQSGIGVTEAVAGKADISTTLAGYGITDAYTKTETDTLLGGKVDKVSGATSGNIVVFGASGVIADSNKSIADLIIGSSDEFIDFPISSNI